MKNLLLIVVCYCVLHLNTSLAQESLHGDEKLACEALLCLPTSSRLAECAPSLQRYFSISYKKFSDTLRGRMNFLNMCPMVTDTKMTEYKTTVINGSGQCDAASINQSSYVNDDEGPGHVNNTMPDYCLKYYGAPYMQSVSPVYVGSPSQGGCWVEANDYDTALSAYNAARASAANTPAN